MKSALLLTASLFFIFLVFVINLLAHHFYLYWQTGWVDSLAHFFGGLGATLFLFWISDFYKNSAEKITLLYSLVYVLMVGILWESLEYNFGLVFYSNNYISDTFSDLIMDLFGGVLGYSMVKYLFYSWRKN